MGDVKSEVLLITPAMAEQFLKRNTGNRPIRPATVNRFAGALKRGEWRMNGEAIKISEKGRLMDGQHRLKACVSSDESMKTLVIEGLEDNTQETMDQGQRRTLPDTLKMRNEKYINELAASLRIIHAFQTQGSLVPVKAMTVQEGIYTLEHNPSIRNSADYIMKLFPTKYRWAPRTMLTALHYLMSSIEHEDAVAFMVAVSTGADMDSTDPRLVLRETYKEFIMSKDPINNRMRTAVTVKAWNQWRAGNPVVGLTFRAGGARPEQFPHLDGLTYPDIKS